MNLIIMNRLQNVNSTYKHSGTLLENQIQDFQWLFDKDSRTFNDLVSFQGLSRSWKSGKKIKDFQAPARVLLICLPGPLNSQNHPQSLWRQTYMQQLLSQTGQPLPTSRHSFTIPLRVGGWVGLSGWLYAKMIYPRGQRRYPWAKPPDAGAEAVLI